MDKNEKFHPTNDCMHVKEWYLRTGHYFVPTAIEDRYLQSFEHSPISSEGDLSVEYDEETPDMTFFG